MSDKKIKDSKIIESESSTIPIYTGVFLINPVIDSDTNNCLFALSTFHVTYHYQPGDPIYPDFIAENDWTHIIHKGVYDDGEVLASKVWLLTPDTGIQEKIEKKDNHLALRNQHSRILEDGTPVDPLPLHITWSVADGISPVTSGERLKDIERKGEDSEYYKYLTPVEVLKSGILNNDHSLNANDLDENSTRDKEAYIKRITPIFAYMNPMGIWKTFRAEPK